MLTKEQEQVFHDAWAKRFVWSFVEERFAASASRCTETSYEVKADSTTAFVFTQHLWRHPQTGLTFRRV